MKKSQLLFTFSIIVLISVAMFAACSKSSSGTAAPDPCAGIAISVTATTTDADAGTPNGSIAATATGSTGFTFSLNSGSFQASGSFSNLAAGTYTVTAKNATGCTGSASITVNQKDACAGKTITVTPTVSQNADPCAPNGTVTVTATGSTGFTYNVDGAAFQASATFSTLTAGNHTFGAKDNAGCVKTATINVPAITAGAKFTAVKTMMQANCAVSGCHNGTQSPNFTDDCTIVANADLIKFRAVDQAGTSNQMPQPPRAPLTQADQDKITAWFSAGHHFTD
jgi:hypothetical protein